MVKFVEEFNENTNYKYKMLKLNSATYYKDKHSLTIKFIISAQEIMNLTQEMKDDILETCKKMFDGVDVEVTYTRAFADENVVRNKILEYFNKCNQIIFRRINDENTKIYVSDTDINIEFFLDTPLFHLFVSGNTEEGLSDFLDSCFTQYIDIKIVENVVDTSELAASSFDMDTTYVAESSLRLIDIKVRKRLYSRRKVGGIGQMPNYIEDLKDPADNVVLCGKVSNVASHQYANKKYDPNNPKFGPEKCTLVNFIIDDTTGKFECVCFPKEENDINDLMALVDGDSIVCSGSAAVSKYNNHLQLTADCVFTCDIDFSSIKEKASKPCPKNYMTISPKPFEEIEQGSIFDEKTAVAPYMQNKTFVIYDLEATDKVPETAEIIEIAACKVVNGVITETFQSLINPGMEIPEKITELTSITNEMVQDAPNIKSVIPDFYKFTRDAILVGHNIIEYDYPLLNKYCIKEGYKLNNDLVDTLILARKYITEVRSKALTDLSKAFNINHENAHRALSDVLATYGVLKILSTRVPNN